MKKSLIAVSGILFSLVSCASVRVPVPGEAQIKKNNIYIEYMAIADAYNDLAKYDKAITYYQLAAKNRDLYWTALYKTGRAYAMNKNWAESKKIYQKLLERDADNTVLKMSLAYICAMDGDFEDSEKIYSELWEASKDNQDVLVNYINVLFAREKTEEAASLVAVLKEKFKDNSNIPTFEKKLADSEKE